MIKAIFFDVGGTLIHPDMGRLMAPLLQRAQPGPAALVAAERAAKLSFRHEPSQDDSASPRYGNGGHAGPVNKGYWQTFFEALLSALGNHDDLLPELTARAGDSGYWSLVDPAAVAVLGQLRREYRLGIISNADGNIDRVLQQAGLLAFFEHVVDSGVIGCEKPDPHIFQAAMEGLGVEPAESLYVGDIYAIDYQGATGAGLRALLIDPNRVYGSWPVSRISSLAELPAWLDLPD